jgi:hypothetical protein
MNIHYQWHGNVGNQEAAGFLVGGWVSTKYTCFWKFLSSPRALTVIIITTENDVTFI